MCCQGIAWLSRAGNIIGAGIVSRVVTARGIGAHRRPITIVLRHRDDDERMKLTERRRKKAYREIWGAGGIAVVRFIDIVVAFSAFYCWKRLSPVSIASFGDSAVNAER